MFAKPLTMNVNSVAALPSLSNQSTQLSSASSLDHPKIQLFSPELPFSARKFDDLPSFDDLSNEEKMKTLLLQMKAFVGQAKRLQKNSLKNSANPMSEVILNFQLQKKQTSFETCVTMYKQLYKEEYGEEITNKQLYKLVTGKKGPCWVLKTAIEPRLRDANLLPENYDYDQIKDLIRADFKEKTSFGLIKPAGLIGAIYLRIENTALGRTIVNGVKNYPQGTWRQNRGATDVLDRFLTTLPSGKRLAALSTDDQARVNELRQAVEDLMSLKPESNNTHSH